MKIGIVNNETWRFIYEVYDELKAYHQVSPFRIRELKLPFMNYRINIMLLKRDLKSYMKANDVVLYEWASKMLAIATNMRKYTNIVTRVHRYEMYKWTDQIRWENVDKIILDSYAKKSEFDSRYPAHAHKTRVIYVGVDVEKYPFAPKPFKGNIGILCNIIPRKRVYELVLAFYELLRNRPLIHLHIGGGPQVKSDDYDYAIRDLIQKMSLQENITYNVKVDDVRAWYKNVDIFVSNSYSEGLQIAPLEAMASGCYVLSHRWAGAEEMVPEECLYYTDSELQRKILEYYDLTEEEKNNRLKMMRKRVETYFNVHKTKVKIRLMLEKLGCGMLASR